MKLVEFLCIPCYLSYIHELKSILKGFQHPLSHPEVCVQSKLWVLRHKLKGIAAGFFEDGEVFYEVAYSQLRQSMLTCPKKLAWPP